MACEGEAVISCDLLFDTLLLLLLSPLLFVAVAVVVVVDVIVYCGRTPRLTGLRCGNHGGQNPIWPSCAMLALRFTVFLGWLISSGIGCVATLVLKGTRQLTNSLSEAQRVSV